MDPSSDDLGSFPLSEIIPQLFDTIRRVELAYADYPEAYAILSRMSDFLTAERLGLAQLADTDLEAAKRLERLLLALNELCLSMNVLKFGQPSALAEFQLKDLYTPIILLIPHGLATIERIEGNLAN